MGSLVPRTALPGWSRSMHDEVARGLGYFSIALGVAELAAPGAICRAAGIHTAETVVRAYGAREMATGIAILGSHDPTPWIWGRVAGDALDIATVAAARPDRSVEKGRKLWALAALIGVTALDVFTATCLSSEKGGVRTARADYHDRSGFPKGLQAARGAAREFAGDRRGLEAMRSRTSEAAKPHNQAIPATAAATSSS
jgi:hypothetical protein